MISQLLLVFNLVDRQVTYLYYSSVLFKPTKTTSTHTLDHDTSSWGDQTTLDNVWLATTSKMTAKNIYALKTIVHILHTLEHALLMRILLCMHQHNFAQSRISLTDNLT